MIKLLRKVRQKMITENKYSSYFVYAIGEIVLVVIGILIALQINTLNQNYQRAKLEKVLIKQVKNELLGIYNDIRTDALFLEIGNEGHFNINKYIVSDAIYTDSLCFDFYWIKLDQYIYPVDAAYNRLKEEGLDIIKNDTIRHYLQGLYENVFPRLVKKNAYNPDLSKVFNNYYLNSFKPNIDYTLAYDIRSTNDTVGTRIYHGETYNLTRSENEKGQPYTIGYVPLNFDALKKDPKFHMLLEQTKDYRDYKINHYSDAKFLIKEVIKIIDRELKNSDEE